MTYERCAKKRKRGYGTDLQRCLQVRQKVEVLGRMLRKEFDRLKRNSQKKLSE